MITNEQFNYHYNSRLGLEVGDVVAVLVKYYDGTEANPPIVVPVRERNTFESITTRKQRVKMAKNNGVGYGFVVTKLKTSI